MRIKRKLKGWIRLPRCPSGFRPGRPRPATPLRRDPGPPHSARRERCVRVSRAGPRLPRPPRARTGHCADEGGRPHPEMTRDRGPKKEAKRPQLPPARSASASIPEPSQGPTSPHRQRRNLLARAKEGRVNSAVTASANSRGRGGAQNASHWPRSRLDADWSRLSAAARRGSHWRRAPGVCRPGLHRLPRVKVLRARLATSGRSSRAEVPTAFLIQLFLLSPGSSPGSFSSCWFSFSCL